MFELTYSSFSNPNLNDKDLTEIDRLSKINNSKNNITGRLVHYKNEFIQILEGNELIVKNLFSKIKKDNRHRGVILLYSGPILKKQFEGWKMINHEMNLLETNSYSLNLFKKNLNSLSILSDSKTTGSNIFWNSVANLTEIE